MLSTSTQQEVNQYFQSAVSYWNDIYFDKRLLPMIYRERQETAIEWIRILNLTRPARILEIGCGAGFMSVALAREGYSVDAMDSTVAMIEVARGHAAKAGMAERIRFMLGDAHSLGATSGTYDLVVALGVIPWLHTEDQAVREMKRVLKDGGYLVITADNEARLNRLLDPLSTPALKPVRTVAKKALRKAKSTAGRPGRFEPKRHYPGQIDRILHSAGFQKLKSTTVGFGLLTLAGKQLLPDSAGLWLHRNLQQLARHNIPPFSLTGLHYMVLARK